MARSKFQTIVDVPTFPWKTGYTKTSLFMGSCFTENIGNKMVELKYPADINPFGILYNPMSVANGLELLLENKTVQEEELIQHNGIWHSFSHHGRFSSTDKKECLENINGRIKTSADIFKRADFLFLTFGTSWIYRLKSTDQIVSNCHKIPAKEFVRQRLSFNEIIETYEHLLKKIWIKNPKLRVVFTVSPIRHWKDGAIENQRSKAGLILAVDELIKIFGKEKCAYFPSYEIVMDELRDYRFYSEDMLHLTDVAVHHIWEIFEHALIEEKDRKTAMEIKKIVNAARHRPMNKNSREFYNFLTGFQKKIAELETRFPFINLRLEKEYFDVQIHKFKTHLW